VAIGLWRSHPFCPKVAQPNGKHELTFMSQLSRPFSRFINAIVLYSVPFLSAIRGQDTVQFGFEEFPADSTPPFVSPGPLGGATVYRSSTASSIQPFEGQQFLLGNGEIHLASPDGQLIQSFTIHAFGTGTNQGFGRTFFNVGNQSVQEFGSWQTVQGSFEDPVSFVRITSFNIETARIPFGIDAVQFTTVPEPQTFALLAFAFSLIPFARKVGNRKGNTS
jgi:hypothetical protein